MTILLHICCGPCLLGIAHWLEQNGHHYLGYFHNPNIHPLIEFRRRLKAVKMLKYQYGMPIRIDERYGLRPFLRQVVSREDDRCRHCYHMRLEQTAILARQESFDAFSTTLLGSPDQKHELIKQIGNSLSRDLDIEFFYQDWRHLYDKAHQEARSKKLYLQNYCGCIYSEYDRFKHTTRHLYRPATAPSTRACEDEP